MNLSFQKEIRMSFHVLASAADVINLGLPRAVATHFPALPQIPPGIDALVYCDGACSGNGVKESAPGGWGALVLEGSQVRGGFGGSAGTTNNRMELSAAIQALQLLPKGAKALVRTDSQYVIKGCTEWRAGWVRKGMKNSKGEPVANPELWKTLWAEVDARQVKFEWVKGHNGDAGNELADALAVRGTQR